MPISKVYEPVAGVRVALWRLDEDSDTLRAAFPDGERSLCDEAVAGLSHETRRCERLAARLLLRRLGLSGRVVYTSQGKPEIFDETAHFSISHTSGWVAVAVSTRPIGVDIERWGGRAWRVSGRFLAPEELLLLPADAAHEAATMMWSAKESMYKLLGAEEVDFARHLRLAPFSYENTSLGGPLEAYENRTPARRNFCIYYGCFPDFVLTLAVE